MDATLNQLGHLLLEAVPTALFFVLLTVSLNHVFFKPMARILEERRKATEGVRELARRAFESAEKKNSEFEHALHIARAELHQEHEALRRQWSEEQAQAIAQARAEADTRVQAARQQIAQEAARAEADLDARIETFSRQIEDAVLTRRAA